MQNHLHSADTQQGVILTKALKNAADYWGVNNKHLGDVIGLSEASVSRLKNGQYVIDPKSKSWQLAVLFLRVFRGLDAYMGGNIDNEKYSRIFAIFLFLAGLALIAKSML